LARQQEESANQKKTKRDIARLHEKVRRRRRAFNHRESSKLVEIYGGIAVEDIQLPNLIRRPKPKKKEKGAGYERNNAKAKSGLNKSFADAGLGQFLQQLESKSKAVGRHFVKVPPAYTSQDCPSCGSRVKKTLSTRTHRCLHCGLVLPRDVASAIIIKKKAFSQG